MLSTLKTPMMEAANGKKNEGVPTVDLKGLPALTAPGDLNSLKEIGENLDNALKLYGGTYLTNTGVPPKAIQNLLLHSRNFFEKPEASKLKYESKRRKMVGCPVAEYFGYYRSKEQMFRERFDFPLGWGGALAYPEAVVAGITESVKECQSALNSVASFVLARMEEVLGLEKKELSQIHLGTLSLDKEIMTKSHISSIFYNYTPTGSHNLELMEAHTDKSSMTFLYSTAPGLQVQGRQTGKWFDAMPLEGSIFLHIGDLLEYFTGGRYRAIVHRVREADGESTGRQSFAYFIHPNEDALIAPLLPPLPNAHPAPRITAGKYFEEKIVFKKLLVETSPSA